MVTERVDGQVSRLLETAQPALRPGWEERAVQAMVSSRPARVRSRRGLIAVAAGAVMVLLGLGFVPFPVGKATGAWDRAVAAAEQSASLHLTGQLWTEVGEFGFEQWMSEDGFSRYDLLEGEQVVAMSLSDPGKRQIIADSDPERNPIRKRAPLKPVEVAIGILGPTLRLHFDRANVTQPPWHAGTIEWLQNRKQFALRLSRLEDVFDLAISERRERALWGGSCAVVVAEGPAVHGVVLGDPFFLPLYYLKGDRIRIRAEISDKTGRLTSLALHKLVDGTWQQTYATDSMEWDVEVVGRVRDVRPPSGHIELLDKWWAPRLDEVLARGSSKDWDVTLHAMDVNRDGDLFLTLSRRPKPDSRFASRDWRSRLQGTAAWALDDKGSSYTASTTGHSFDTPRLVKGYPDPVLYAVPESHVRVRLDRGGAKGELGSPETVMVTIGNGAPDGKSMQSVTFRGLPLPARQSGADLFAEAYEKRYL